MTGMLRWQEERTEGAANYGVVADGWLAPGAEPASSSAVPPDHADPRWLVGNVQTWPPPPSPPLRRPQPSRSPLLVALAIVISIVLVAGVLVAAANQQTNSRTKFADVGSSIDTVASFSSPEASSTEPSPPPDPVAPPGFTLHHDNFGGYAVALPADWIIIDVVGTGGIDVAFTVAKQLHPERTVSLDNLRPTFAGDELVGAMAPLTGAVVTDLVVSKAPPLHGITSDQFIASYRDVIKSQLEPKAGSIDDLVIAPTAVGDRPALKTTFSYEQTLSSGATDRVLRYTVFVEGDRADYRITMTTDRPDQYAPIFEQAAMTLTPLN